MSKLLLRTVACVLAVLPCSAETLTIFTSGTAEPADAVRAEVGRLLEPAGYTVEWKNMSDRKVGEDFANLIVVRYQGACDPKIAPPPGLAARPLASTVVTDGRVLPFATIDCDAIRSVMGPASRPTHFARAVARVLAHEVYHMVARSKSHAHAGVSKACFGAADLIAEDFAFDRTSLAQMRPVVAVPFEEEVGESEPSGR
jgi:hypothetical protein